jgi:Transposase DDE domain
VVPKFVSASDPAAQWTGALKGPAFFAYANNYLIDVQFGVIVDVEASRAVRQAEVGAARTMLQRTEQRFHLKPQRLAADSAYGSAQMLNWLVAEKKITPHIPVLDKSQREDGTFSRSDFRYDATNDVYQRPAGKQLRTSGTVHDGKTLLYRASKRDCDICLLKSQCCPKAPQRKIPRDVSPLETLRDPSAVLKPLNSRGAIANALRCDLRTSSASSGLTDFGCADLAEPGTNSCSGRLPKI